MIGTVNLEQRNALRRIYGEIEAVEAKSAPPEASQMAREALERLLEGREFPVVLQSLPDFAEP